MTKKDEENITEEEDYTNFWTDPEFYCLWQFTKEKYLPLNENDLVALYETIPERYYDEDVLLELLNDNMELDERWELHLYNDSEYRSKLPKTKEELQRFNRKQHSKILSICTRIEKSKFTYEEYQFVKLALPTWIDHDIYLLPKEDIDQDDNDLKSLLDNYINLYINWELLVDWVNYYNFQKNKELFIRLIRETKALEQYWRNFIVTNNLYGKPFYQDKESLFAHTVYALEYLWYLKVLDIDAHSWDYPTYKINILPKESFKELIYQDFKKENPKTIIEWYDEKKWVLTFAWKKISISKSWKETDASLLIKTLLKTQWDDYHHNDEIYEDWGFNEEDIEKASKNKIYFAWQKINKDIQLATWIEDFLDITTTKARINPKYR